MSKRTIRRKLHQEGNRRGKIQKTLTICKINRQRPILWCRGKRHWRPEQWQKVIFSDETQVVIGQNNFVSLWRKLSEKWKPYCLNQCKTASKVSCMFWGCITYDGIGVLVTVDGNLNSTKYIELLDNSLWIVIVKFLEIDHLFSKMIMLPPIRLDRPITGKEKTESPNLIGLHNLHTLT